MRNLTLQSARTIALAGASLCASAPDLEQDVLYVASERYNADADVESAVWRINGGGGGAQQEPDAPAVLIATLTSTSNPWSAPFPAAQLAAFHFLPDTRTLVLVMRGGDIAALPVDDAAPEMDVVGTIDAGILAAAWSPDDTLLALVTGDAKLMLMTSAFDVLSEAPFHTSDFGADAPINVGWGSKQTQFHGSLGKAAASAPAPAARTAGASPDDDRLPRIAWRGDGAFFAVSALTPDTTDAPPRRTLRVYDRHAALKATSEPLAGLEHALAWQPAGALIAGAQRFGYAGGAAGRAGRHDVVFFERNGLRHGEFALRERGRGEVEGRGEGEERRWGYRVREMAWSADSSVLAVWLERDAGDVVQLWTTGNYHWYLKQEITAPSASTSRAESTPAPARFTSVRWHPEKALELCLTTATQLIQRTYALDTYASAARPPGDSGAVAVVDGATLLLTPFRTQNVPPPLSSVQLAVHAPAPSASASPPTPPESHTVPIHASFAASSGPAAAPDADALAVLWEKGRVRLWDLHTRVAPGRGAPMAPVLVWEGDVGQGREGAWRQVVVTGSEGGAGEGEGWAVHVLGAGEDGRDVVARVHTARDKNGAEQLRLPARNGRLVAPAPAHGGDGGVFWQSPDGEIFAVDVRAGTYAPVCAFGEFCVRALATTEHTSSAASSGAGPLFIGLAQSGKLYAASVAGKGTRVLAPDASSVTLAAGCAIWTSTAHAAHFAPLGEVAGLLSSVGAGAGDDDKEKEKDNVATTKTGEQGWETRRVERGARIVVAVPSAMALVLQMPRGNLETVYPRPLVLGVVRQDVAAGNWRAAFLACRTHRVDLGTLVAPSARAFAACLPAFVAQVHEVDHLTVFLTAIGRSALPQADVALLCDALRGELEARGLARYVHAVLTAFVVKTPPDHEGALALLLRLRETHPERVEDAVRYVIFLADADRLFDTALGMYDFALVLLVAQHAQKDPREYLPFLRALRALDGAAQRFRIDDHLGRRARALASLQECGDERFDEAMAYVETHRLHEEALALWRDTPRYPDVLAVYAAHLFDRREFAQAALVFVTAYKPAQAVVAYEKALAWREALELAARTGADKEALGEMGYRLAEDLGTKKRHEEAARVLLDYCEDVRGAVSAFVEGGAFGEARRIATMHGQAELLGDVIEPGLLERAGELGEEAGEMRAQLGKQTARVRELRVRRVEAPEAFFGAEEDSADLHNVDVMTDVSRAATAFTRYTAAPTSLASRSSKRSSRSKRKLERKAGAGRKGTVDEEEYLLGSVSRLVGRFAGVRAHTNALLPHLAQFSEEHRAAARTLRADVVALETELGAAVDEIWRKAEDADAGTSAGEDTWASRMQERERGARAVDPIDKVAKPQVRGAGAGDGELPAGLLSL